MSANRRLHVLSQVSLVQGLVLCILVVQPAIAQTEVDVDRFLQIRIPSAVAWSPDGRQLAYQITGPTGSEVRLYSLAEKKTTTVAVGIPPYRYLKEAPDLRWTPDGTRVLYRQGGDYLARPVEARPAESLVSAGLLGDLVQLSPDQHYVSFIRDGDIWIQPVAGMVPKRLTRGEGLLSQDAELFSRLFQWPAWSPDSKRLAFVSRMESGFKVGVVFIDDGEIRWVVPDEDMWAFTIVDWSPDGQRLAISRLSRDLRRKELLVADLAHGQSQMLWADRDDRWVSHNVDPSFHVAWSPDSNSVAFLSNRSGWTHIYIGSVQGGESRQLTQGSFDVHWVRWSPDGRNLLFVSSESHLQQRLLWLVQAEGGARKQLFRKEGMCLDSWWRQLSALPSWSPDGRQIVFAFSGPEDAPGVWLIDSGGTAEPTQIYSSLPDGMRNEDLARMETVRFRSGDGTEVPGVLLTPRKKRAEKHPALVHMYGGWGQMAGLGWPLGIKSILFQYLVSAGYVVLIVDPRGSEGYGNAYSKGLFREGGGKQVDDLVAAARFLQGLGYVDPHRIGIFGHSYGGYLAIQAMVQTPGVFAAGVTQAGVFDWEAYARGYARYIDIRFGAPHEVPNLVRTRSPINQVDRLAGALLVVHGSGDFNAPISASDQLVMALMRAGKEFDYMVYPGEPHSWVAPEVNRDFLLRIRRFLDRYLKQPSCF